MRVTEGRVVSLDYLVRLGSGQVVETSMGKDPIEYLHGGGQILPALERALEGLGEGQQAAFSIPCQDAYGDRKEDNVLTLPRTLFPADVELKPGLCLYARASGGQSYPITVREVRTQEVLVDLNHPLAGERLAREPRAVNPCAAVLHLPGEQVGRKSFAGLGRRKVTQREDRLGTRGSVGEQSAQRGPAAAIVEGPQPGDQRSLLRLWLNQLECLFESLPRRRRVVGAPEGIAGFRQQGGSERLGQL